MVVGHNVPEGFVATANKPDPTSVDIAAQNPSPQPAEHFTVDAPVPGGTVRGEIDEMDTNTSVDETMSTTSNGTKHFHVQNSNANANSGEAIQEKVTNSSGVVTLALVLAGPTAQALSGPATDWNFSWLPMPSTFTMDVDFNTANRVYVNVGLTSPQPDSGQLRVDSGDDHKHVVLTGTASSQSFTRNAPNSGTNSSHSSISG